MTGAAAGQRPVPQALAWTGRAAGGARQQAALTPEAGGG
ncbi:hypothetical protein ThesuDRAFT_00489 [Thermaerobacter subterraneus DSM 13965]|uniref:Uncharacterized protein n=1 Tax=Thermaerobacter subterraneus DSM 13965 TaxID=867903 RepID=K6P106_9FIRM|nr:hypothetical protein ThesuDRAFT_00489 [Thermaerobacter subterraneus DSM 13965]